MKTRVISAIIAIILVVPFIYYGGIPYALAVSFLALYSYKEILDLKKLNKDIPNQDEVRLVSERGRDETDLSDGYP